MNDQPRCEWERLPGEPARWFARFEAFRALGPHRSLLATYNAEREEARNSAAQTVPATWRERAEEWRWRERAEAFDAHERQRIEAERRAVRDRRRRELEDVEWRRANGLLAMADRIELEIAAMAVLGRSVRKGREYVEAEGGDEEAMAVEVASETNAIQLLAELRRLTGEGIEIARRSVGLPASYAPEKDEHDEAATRRKEAEELRRVLAGLGDITKAPAEEAAQTQWDEPDER